MIKTNRIDGSYTVEAALIMPLVFFMILGIVLFAIYLNDACKIQSVVNRTLYMSGGIVSYEASRDNKERRMEQYLQQELEKNLLITELTYVDAKASASKVSLSAKAETKLSLVEELILINETSPIHNPSETIRMSEVILETASKIKGVNDLKDKIEDIIK